MRGKVSKIAMFMLVLCMTVSMFAVDAFAADATTPIDSCNRIVEAYDLDDAEDYINDNNASTYPTCKTDGYLFAGWYTKETCTDDSYWGHEEQEKPGDTVYALFVPSHVLGVKAQISSNLLDKNTSDDDTASIRFVTTVDSLLYRQAGFEISYVGTDGQTKNATSASNKVYKKLYAIGSNSEEYKEDDVLEYTPEGSFCGLSTYFKACTVSKIGSEFFSTAFTVKPYVITMDGSKVYGETVVKSINDYFLAEEVWVSSTDANRADTVENGTEAKPFETLNYALGMVKNGGTVHVKDSYVAPSDFAWKDHDKTVTITGGTIDFTSVSEVAINDSVTFTSTTLTFVNGQYIYANGNKVEITESVTWGDASAYVCIYGGAYKTALKSDTNLVLGAGYYKRVYGGGNAGSVTGDVNVTLSGNINTGINYANHTLTYAAFGGGENGCTVKGDINFTIADSSVLFDYVYGGGYGSSVTGDITVNFSGKSMSVYGGCRNGSVTGDTYLIMTGANAWVEQLFGGCQASTATVVSNVYGNTNVDVQDGTVVRRVYGGCYNDAENKILTLSWTSSYKVTGHTNVSISPNATFSLNYSELDNSIYSLSRYKEVMADEWGAFIFNADSYTNTYKSKLGYNDSMYSSSFSSQSYHYLITTNGNTADGSYGTVSSAGDYIRIEPKSGYSATVSVGGTQEYYTESEGVFQLPPLTNTTDTRDIVVTFGAIDSSVDKTGYEAKIDGAYYDTLEEAVDAAYVLDKEDVVTITLLKNAEVEETLVITDSANIKVVGENKYTINRADELVDGNIFNVKDGSILTVDNVVLDGRTSSQLAAGTMDLGALTGSTQSLIYNAGTTNLQNMTGQYAVKTKEHGAVLQSGGADDIVTVANSTFRYNKSAGQGAALRMGGNTAKLEVANSVFEYNEVYTLTSTAEDGKVSVLFTGNGGAIGTHADVANIDNCTFVGNKATGYSANNDGSAGAVYSGTSSIVTMTGTDENALFSENSVVNGAGGAVSAGSGKVTITGYTFESNTSTGNGGAIFSNGGSTKIKSVSCTFEGNTATGNGGVAYAGNAGTLIFDEDADCTVEALAKNNKAGGNGGATAQGKNTVVKVTGYKFEENTAQHGGAIQANGDSLSTTVKNAEFVSNKTANLDGTDYAGTGGAIRNQTSAGEFIIVDSKFASNSAKQGGALYNSGVLTMTGTGSANALFDTNSSSDNGGAIYLNGTAVTITGYKFNGNTATGKNGGAICNYSNGSQVLDCQFINNEAAQGGAVYCGGNTNTLTFGVTETPVQEAKFEGNESTRYGGAIGFGNGNLNVTGYSFANNKSATYGGAIYTVGDNNTINITDATFTNNNAANGGAVYAYGDKASTVVIGSTFTDNSATGNAGAVYVARTTATVTIDDSTFGTNSAVNGGALYNVGSLTVKNSALNNNTSTEYAGALFIDESTVTVENTSFTSNQSAEGGAIIVGRIEEVAATETTKATTNYYAGTLNATDCTFTSNTTTGGNGGAILNISGSTANITDTTFTSNESKKIGGAICNNGTLALEGKGKGTALFNSNGIVNDADENGGAIYNGGTLNVTAYVFNSNTAFNGAAVCNYGKTPRFIDCQFINNAAEYIGGAIYNGGGQTIHLEVSKEPVLDARCEGNSAIRRGGAVGSGYGNNYIDGYEFKNNHAGYGGAVYVQNVLDANGKAAYTKISNSDFIDNYSEVTSVEQTNNYGGALQVDGGEIDIETCEFNSNETVKNGGAVYFSNANVTATVKNTTFDGNISGMDGGAIYSYKATLTLVNSTLSNNLTNETTGGAGGALRLYAGNTTIVNTEFSGNTAKGYGGAISASNTATLAISATSEELGVTTATKAKFENNTANGVHATDAAYGGGAVYFGSGTFTLSGYDFTGNTAAGDAGALCCRVATTISDCTFSNNTATGDGGAIAKLNAQTYDNCEFKGNTAGGIGGAVYSYTSTITTSNATFTDNSAVTGGAIYQKDSTNVTLTDSTFTGNDATGEGGAVWSNAGTTTITECIFGAKEQGNTAGTNGGALYIAATRTANVEKTTFEANSAVNGGAIECYDSTLHATSCHFNGNSATTSDVTGLNGRGGGAVNITGNAVATFDGTGTFTSNTAAKGQGGAIYTTDADLTISGYTFTSNSANQAGAIMIDNVTELITEAVEDNPDTEVDETVVAVYDDLNTTEIKISDSKFIKNSSTKAGGAICLNKRTLTLEKTTASAETIFDGNSTQDSGGAIQVNTTSGILNVSNYTFVKNTATYQGGAIHCHGKEANISSCTFGGAEQGNIAGTNGGAFYGGSSCKTTFDIAETALIDAKFESNKANGNSSYYGGGAIAMGSGNITVKGYSFIGNEAVNYRGGAIYHNSSENKVTVQDSEFDGNIAANNGGAIYTKSNCDVTGSNFINNDAGNQGGAVYMNAKTLNVSTTTFGGTSTETDENGEPISLGNTAKQGGALYAASHGTIKLNGTLQSSEVMEGNSVTGSSNFGGGAICIGSGTLEVVGYKFKGNTSGTTGGAIHQNDNDAAVGGILTITNSEFESNNSSANGGAVWSVAPSTTITSSEFTSNSSTYGGAVHAYKVTLEMDNSEFTSNTSANATTSGTTGKGGGALNIVGNSNATITNCTFTTNSTNQWGGAIYTTDSKMSVTGSSFDGNTATHAAAILFDNAKDDSTLETSTMTVTDSIFTKNQGTGSGAMYINTRTVTFTDCQFGGTDATSGNAATNGNGGVIWVGASGTANFINNTETSTVEAIMQNNSATGNGGTIGFGSGATVTVQGYKFASNSAKQGGAIYTEGSLSVTNGEFSSNQSTGNGGAIYMKGNAVVSLTGTGAFTSNVSSAFGGAIYSQATKDNSLTIDGYTFDGNKGTFGGALMLYNSAGGATVSNSTFQNNEATSNEGGAIYFNSSEKTMTITDCSFIGNTAAKTGGAITHAAGTMTINVTDGFTGAVFQNNSTSSNDKGGAIYLYAGTLNVNGYTFTNNTPQDIYIYTAKSPTLNGDGNYTTNQ